MMMVNDLAIRDITTALKLYCDYPSAAFGGAWGLLLQGMLQDVVPPEVKNNRIKPLLVFNKDVYNPDVINLLQEDDYVPFDTFNFNCNCIKMLSKKSRAIIYFLEGSILPVKGICKVPVVNHKTIIEQMKLRMFQEDHFALKYLRKIPTPHSFVMKCLDPELVNQVEAILCMSKDDKDRITNNSLMRG
jgi:hypothetical protein